MKTLLKKISNNEDILPTNKKSITTVKSFSDYGHKRSGLNSGDATAFKTHLSWIKDGYVVDENYNEQESSEKRKDIESQIEDKKEEKQNIIADIKVIEEVQIPNKKQEKVNLSNSITQVKNDLDNEMLETGYQSTNYYLYIGLTISLSLYLLFFYASAIYSAFFRSAGLLIETSGDELAMVIGSIFDMKGIINPSPNLIIVYLGSFLFFALGIIPHTIKGKYKNLKMTLFLIGTLVVDALLAYKIDNSIYEIKVLSGIAEGDWHFWASENFYLVLAFGYLAYLVFGYIYQLMIEEKVKKNPKKIAIRRIKLLQEQIKETILTINKYQEDMVALESKIKMIESKLELLNRRLNEALINPEVLSQSLNSFYIGWIQFLNGSLDYENQKLECNDVYKQFMEENFKTLPSLN